MSIWLPGFTRINGRRSGALPRVSDAPARCVLHTDEVGRNTRAMAQAHEWPPQLWVNPATRERYQLIDLARTGYALLRPAGAPETNHMGRCVQVEIAGHANTTHDWPTEWLQWLATEVVRPIHEHAGVPLTAHRDVGLGSEEAYGRHAPTRMSRAAWRSFSGFCTHQNVCDNAHWDCGRLDLGQILTYAQPDPDREDPNMFIARRPDGHQELSDGFRRRPFRDWAEMTRYRDQLGLRVVDLTHAEFDMLVSEGR